MKMKKPSVKGMQNVAYLERFQKDEFIQQGHNMSVLPPDRIAQNLEKKRVQGVARPGSATTLSQGLAGLVNKLRASRLRKRKPPQGGNMPGDGGGFF